MVLRIMSKDNDLKYVLQETTFFDKVYFFVILIYAGMASQITNSLVGFTGSYFGIIFPIFLTLVLVIYHRVKVNRSFLAILGMAALWLFFQTIKQNAFYPTSLLLFFQIFIAYVLVKVYHRKLFYLYEHYVTILSLIGLILWILSITFGSSIISFLDTFNINGAYFSHNIIVFTYIPALHNDSVVRNAGFAWEPGRYAIMLIFAIFFNLQRNNFNPKSKNLWILLIALLSTQSTTGIFVSFLLIFYTLLNIRKIEILSLFVIAGIFLALFINEENFSKKVKNNWFQNYSDLEYHIDKKSISNDESTTGFQRFDAATIQLINFIHDPILGYGINKENSYVDKFYSNNIKATNGLIGTFSIYGFIITLFLYFQLFKTSIYLSHFYNRKGSFIFFLVFLLNSFSYFLINVPMFLSFVLYNYFENTTIPMQKLIYKGSTLEVS